MRFAVHSSHSNFFKQHRYIEFQDLLSEKQIEALTESIETHLASRLGVPSDKLNMQTAEALYSAGRDLWRDSPIIKKVVHENRFGEIAAQLFDKPSVRLAYDQTWRCGSYAPTTLITPVASLNEISSFQGLLGGLVLCLSDGTRKKPETVEPSTPAPIKLRPAKPEWLPIKPVVLPTLDIFPYEPGSGIFFNGNAAFSSEALSKGAHQLYLLIAYTAPVTVYRAQGKDIHTHSLKKLGYGFGDRLTAPKHPIIY